MKVYNPLINYLFEAYLRSGEHPMKQRFVSYIDRFFNYRSVKSSTIYNFEMGLDLRDLIQNKIFFERVWEQFLSKYINDNLRNDDIFYDIGCNVGYFSLLAAKKEISVFSFDPDPNNVLKLEYHKKINKLHNIIINNIGVGEQNESLKFYRASILNNGMSGFTSRNTVNNFDVPVLTLDYLVYEQKCLKPTFIKIDTEGWEMKILKGASKLLSTDPPRIIIFEDDGIGENSEDLNAIISFLQDYNYKVILTLNDDHGINHVAKYNAS